MAAASGDNPSASQFLPLPFYVSATYGGNTSCVQISGGEEYVICDAGTGLRDLGYQILRERARQPARFHLFLSHLHWDHIQGFPFFAPAYIPGNRITIYGGHPDIEKALTLQQEPPFFPVPLKSLAAEITFRRLQPDETYEIAGFQVALTGQDHPGVSYGYAFSRNGKKIVYSTDSEHKDEGPGCGSKFETLIEGADLLIFDAQYMFVEAADLKRDWGHSSNILAVEFAIEKGVKHLVLFHTEPALDDEALDKILHETRRYASLYAGDNNLLLSMAYDGMKVRV
jgi:phosphoribosyl 1,2-cyclic phosphodiesterase